VLSVAERGEPDRVVVVQLGLARKEPRRRGRRLRRARRRARAARLGAGRDQEREAPTVALEQERVRHAAQQRLDAGRRAVREEEAFVLRAVEPDGAGNSARVES